MKKYILIFIIMTCSFMGQSQSEFYYYFNNKILIEKHLDNYAVKLNKNSNKLLLKTGPTEFLGFPIVKRINDNLIILELQGNQDFGSLTSSEIVEYVYPVYLNKTGDIIITNEITLKFKFNYLLDTIFTKQLLESNSLEIISRGRLHWVVKCKKEVNSLLKSNELFETGFFEYCHPDFYSNIKPQAIFPTDPFFNKQFYLHNTGQIINDGNSGTAGADIRAPDAWEITKGNPNIVIAVIDEGLTSDHPDLPNSRQIRLNGSNIGGRSDNTNQNDPSPTGNNNHGNACAGIIAATHNNEGIAGIAPNCKIMPIRMAFGPSPNSHFADAITFAVDNSADVISNSWGGGSQNSAISDAISDAIVSGRNGRGCVVVFAAGNFFDNNTSPSFPAATNIAGLICVGASDRNDNRTLYSPLGAAMDIVAPSHKAYCDQDNNESFEIWTLDIPGTSGYNPSTVARCDIASGEKLPSAGTNFLSYTGRMGGTSSSCPEVAGVAALMLSKNPCLRALEVEEILKRNADKVGGFNYDHDSNRPGHSNEFGFGRLNAFRALTDVINIQNKQFTSNTTIKSSGTIHAGFNVTSSIPSGLVVVNSNIVVKFIAVDEIILFEGFETTTDADFTAELAPVKINCDVWGSISMPIDTFTDEKYSVEKDINININQNLSKRPKVNTFPNPNNGNFTVEINDETKSSVALILTDITGKQILSKKLPIGQSTTQIETNNLSNGIYMLIIKTNEKQTTQKIIINNP